MKQIKPICIGINGYKKSGKTTLIEQLLGELAPKGLRIAVIKCQNEPVRTDQPGTDTDRFYQAGANVLAYDGQAVFTKSHQQNTLSLDQALDILGPHYDLVLVEGYKEGDIAKIWLLRPSESQPPPHISNIIAVLGWDEDRPTKALSLVLTHIKGRD